MGEVKAAGEWFRNQSSILSTTWSLCLHMCPMGTNCSVPENVQASGMTVHRLAEEMPGSWKMAQSLCKRRALLPEVGVTGVGLLCHSQPDTKGTGLENRDLTYLE